MFVDSYFFHLSLFTLRTYTYLISVDGAAAKTAEAKTLELHNKTNYAVSNARSCRLASCREAWMDFSDFIISVVHMDLIGESQHRKAFRF